MPVIAGVFVELVGKAAIAVPLHFGVMAVNVGVMFGFIVMVSVVVVAHCPAVGVKVYKVVFVLFIAGDHVPVIAGTFVELVGNAGIAAPEQNGPTTAKVGVTFGLTVILKVVIVAH